MTKLSSLMLICSIVGFFALAGNCGASDGLDTVTITGSTTVMPLVEICAEEFNMLQKNVMVTVSGSAGPGWG